MCLQDLNSSLKQIENESEKLYLDIEKFRSSEYEDIQRKAKLKGSIIFVISFVLIKYPSCP